MKRLLLLILLPLSAIAQLPIIDSTAIANWVSLGSDDDLAISRDGNYVAYIIENRPVKSHTLIIQSTKDLSSVSIPHAIAGGFLSNGTYIYQLKDTLCYFYPDTQKTEYLPDILSYTRTGDIIACLFKNGELVVTNSSTRHYQNIKSYAINTNGKSLLLSTSKELQFISTNQMKTLLKDTEISGYALDTSGTQVAFISHNRLYYYKSGMDSAISVPPLPGFNLASMVYFNGNNKYVLLYLQELPLPPPSPNAAKLDIWSYTDTILQSTQLSHIEPHNYVAVFNPSTKRLIRLEYPYELSQIIPTGDYMLFVKNTNGDRFWLNDPDSSWLVYLEDGTRIPLHNNLRRVDYKSSPDGRYVIYYHNNTYYSYDLYTSKVKNISDNATAAEFAAEDISQRRAEKMFFPLGIAAWLADNKSILVHEKYDLWQLDITGQNPAINLTNGYGRKHHIKLRLPLRPEVKTIPSSKHLILNAYNEHNKENGFYKTTNGDPIKLIMGPYVFCLWGPNMYAMNDLDFDKGAIPLKAVNVDKWVIERQTATEAPNYYITNDFKNLKALTNLHPQTEYNWLTDTLIRFKQLDGTWSQGILYKPADFDPSKKYPVLFNYYEQMSQRLHQFPTPGYTRNNINIPWFVSRGYLVCTPDIYFDLKHFGYSALNTVEGAAKYLSGLQYVNGRRMAINGHSTGGYLTNYIITHSTTFAAAIEGAGTSDVVSSALQLSVGFSRLYNTEALRGALWKSPSTWLDESPILRADKVTTPLIIFHSKSDTAVPWEQAVELFTALRRLNKQVWILQYDNGNHGVWDDECIDYTSRITQFFDHFLKDATAPLWMTHGIPAKFKGVISGY
jgi:dipeptidyl aminopeptidase/acylaminoacyl peptidase